MDLLWLASGALAAPSKPQNLVVPPLAFSDTSILVHWDKPTQGTPTHYKVYDGTSLVATVTTTRYTKLSYSSPLVAPTPSMADI